MSMADFVPGIHPSHDWRAFEDDEPKDARMCHRCEICTCHSPVASTEPCEFTDPEPSSSATDRSES